MKQKRTKNQTWWIGGYIEFVQTGHSRSSWTLVEVGVPLLCCLEVEDENWCGCKSSSIVIIEDTVLSDSIFFHLKSET
jgi:hypothetical protein